MACIEVNICPYELEHSLESEYQGIYCFPQSSVEDYVTSEDIIVVLSSRDIHIVIDHVKTLKE